MATRSPSGDQATDSTMAPSWSSSARTSPTSRFHSRARRSMPPETRTLPSGDSAASHTVPLWPRRCTGRAAPRSHTRTSPSSPAAAEGAVPAVQGVDRRSLGIVDGVFGRPGLHLPEVRRRVLRFLGQAGAVGGPRHSPDGVGVPGQDGGAVGCGQGPTAGHRVRPEQDRTPPGRPG